MQARIKWRNGMKSYKLSEIADIQSGLVLSRKAAKENTNGYLYKRLTLRSITDECLIDDLSFGSYYACEPISDQFLTKKNDVIIRLFSPLCAALISEEYAGLVVPSQLAIIRCRDDSLFLPGYLSAYLTNGRSIKALTENAGMSAQKIIKIGNIAEVEIPCLPIDDQKMISNIANEQLNIISLYKKIIEQETLRTKSVIKDIIGGKK